MDIERMVRESKEQGATDKGVHLVESQGEFMSKNVQEITRKIEVIFGESMSKLLDEVTSNNDLSENDKGAIVGSVLMSVIGSFVGHQLQKLQETEEMSKNPVKMSEAMKDCLRDIINDPAMKRRTIVKNLEDY